MSHSPLEKCRLVLLSPLTHGENETSERLASLLQFEQVWDYFGKYEVLDLFSCLNGCLAADRQLFEDPAVQNVAE